MAKLVDMKRTASDKKAEKERWDSPIASDDYGYGMTLTLDNAAIEKLGLGDIDVDQPVKLMAECVVTNESINTINGKTERSLSIQIRKMALAQGEATDIVGTLYGKE